MILLATLTVLGAGRPLDLTAQPRRATLSGIVVDSAGRPLEGARVELFGTTLNTTTGPAGIFRFEDLRGTRSWLLARRIGYYPFQTSLTLGSSEAREIRIVMTARPVQLPEVAVVAEDKRYRSRMREFMWRSRSAFMGRFLTRDDVERSRANRLGDLVIRYLPFKNAWTMDQPGGWDYARFDDQDMSGTRLSYRRRYRPDCPPAVSVNGAGITAGWAVNDFDPEEIEALEIYRDGSSLPYEYSWTGQSACGLVVVWLRSYARPTPER
jgi:hypothetical protein